MADFSLDAPGSDGIGIDPVFVASGSAGNDTGTDPGSDTGPRRRKPRSDAGQPRGSRGTRRSKISGTASVDALTRGIIGLTAAISGVSKIPEVAFDDDDAKSEALAIQNFLDQFEIQVDPKLEAAVTLLMTTATIAGAKIYLYKERMKAEKANNITPNANVVDFQNGPFETK